MTGQLDLRIVHLLDVPEAVPVLAAWFISEWTPWYGPGGGGDVEIDLAACASRDVLPICLVALNVERDVLGTVALKTESVGSELGVAPWLAAFLVGERYRGKGVGRALVKAVEGEARRLGFESIYTAVDVTVGARLIRRRWTAFGSAESLRGEVAVYRRQIGEP